MRVIHRVIVTILLSFLVCPYAFGQAPAKARRNATPVIPQTETIEGTIEELRGVALPGMGDTVTAFYVRTGNALKRIVVCLSGTPARPKTSVLRGLDELPTADVEEALNSPGRHVVVTHVVEQYEGAEAWLATRVVLGFAELAEGTVTLTDLRFVDYVVGSGEQAESGRTVTVHYTGWLADGTMFDSSLDAGAPLSVPLGQKRLIAGWEHGIPGMRVGGHRRLLIPSRLGYGVRGAGEDIPPNAVLVFDIELLGVQ